MAGYGNFNVNKGKKGGKVLIVIVCTFAVLFAAVCYIGIRAGNGEQAENISEAVRENTQLKIEIGDLNDKISKMQEEIDTLKAELGTRPTVAPTPYAPSAAPSFTPEPAATISPRTGRR